jgi:hypothetical protein
MKHIRLLFSLFFACLFALPSAFSQDISTQGTEFWVSFMGNGFKTRFDTWTGLPDFTWLRIQLIVSAKRDCNCTVTNPNTNYQQTFHVNANSTYLFDNIPWDEAYMELEEHGRILNKGLRITADDTVSVYCANIAEVSFDASYILPTPALGNDYIIQTYDQSTSSSPYYSNYFTSAFLIVATEEGETTVDITPTVNTLDGHSANSTYSITLRQGEAYQVRSHNNYGSRDLSGTRVTTRGDCKKIAVFNGNNLTMVPEGGNDSDCIFEQAMPLTAWGKKFVVTASLGRQLNDIVKITSAHDNNEIRKNGVLIATLNTGEFTSFELRQSDKSCFIEASQSCAVYLYNHSADGYFGNVEDGAPSMVWIAPIEQRINEITFSTFNYESEHDTHIDDHYVNIIANADDIQHVYLDNELLPSSQFEFVNGTTEYCFIRKKIDHGVHHLSCANGFNAHVYGFGHAKGYAYLVGSKATDLSTTILINGETVQQLDTISSCSLESITFEAEINYQSYEVEWNFGDGTPHSHSITDQHTYDNYGFYEVILTVTSEETPCQASSSISQTIYIELYHTSDTTLYASTCYKGPSTYTENGFNIPYDEPGTYEGSKSVSSSHGCDSIVHLVLEVGDVFHAEPEIQRICYDKENPKAFTWEMGDGLTYYTDTLTTKPLPYGDCQGLFTLDLKFINNDTIDIYYPEYENETVCDSFPWTIDGKTYTTSGVYPYDEDLSPFDCKRVTQLHLNLSYTPDPYIDSYNINPHWPITATEFNVNRYTYFVRDSISDINKWDISQCKWDISKNSWHFIPNPNGDNPLVCIVYAMDWIADSICLSFKAVNACSGDEGVIAEYWLHPSFYDINDSETIQSEFNVVPNPNNGEMELYFENLTGKVSIKVYDMRGALIDVIETYNELNSKTLRYTLEYTSSGIYFFVATAKEGTIAKKVIIE